MGRFNSPLNNVRVAAPCNADWEQMIGNERARFCGQCNLNVYNLSSMTKLEAESFIARNEVRLCVRFYRRADGSIITENCPVGLRAIKRKLSYFAKAISSAVLAFLAGVGIYQGLSSVAQIAPRRTMGVIAREPAFTAPIPLLLPAEMGDVAMGKLIPQRDTSRRRYPSTSHR